MHLQPTLAPKRAWSAKPSHLHHPSHFHLQDRTSPNSLTPFRIWSTFSPLVLYLTYPQARNARLHILQRPHFNPLTGRLCCHRQLASRQHFIAQSACTIRTSPLCQQHSHSRLTHSLISHILPSHSRLHFLSHTIPYLTELSHDKLLKTTSFLIRNLL
jgi:hypothetical protein